jgi:hypothetical protein
MEIAMNNRSIKFVAQMVLLLVSLFALSACYEGGSSGSSANGTSSGTGGSTARFTIQNNHLIVIEWRSIIVYSLLVPNDPIEVYRIYTNGGVLETVFPYKENLLFVGSQNGSFILELDESGRLTGIASISHTRSCDPVVVNDTQMFVTIRSAGRVCGGASISNRLLVYDISSLSNPIETANIVINQPFGLGLQGNTLYVCYADGLKKFDVSSGTPELLNDYQSISCDDLIPNGENLVLTGQYGISQVNSENGVMRILSEIQKGD